MTLLTASGKRRMEGNVLVKTTIVNVVLPNTTSGNGTKTLLPSNYELENCHRIRNIEVMCQNNGGNIFFEGNILVPVTYLPYLILTLKDRRNKKLMDRQPLAVFGANVNSNPIVQNNLLHTFDLPKVFTQNSYVEFLYPGLNVVGNISVPIKLYYE